MLARMRAAWIIILGASLAGCGAKPVAPKNAGTKVAAAKPAVAEKPTCATAAHLLMEEKGVGKLPAKEQDRARRAGEAELEAACLADQWPDAVIQCTTARPQPSTCLASLDDAQQESYGAHLEQWQAAVLRGTGGAGYGGAQYGGVEGGVVGGVEGGVVGGTAGGGSDAPPPPPPEDDFVPCEGSLGDLASYAPAIGPKQADRQLALNVRERAVHTSCEMMWTNDDKKCFAAATDAASVATCRGKLADSARNSLENMIADATARYQHVEALEHTPRAIDCKAVSGAHYGQDAWRGKLTGLAPAERNRVMAESRTKLASTCTAEKWPASMRACLVSAQGNDRDVEDCYPEEQRMQGERWGYPAAGVLFKSGIPECDQLADLVQKIGQCDKLPKDLRDELLGSFSSQLAMWLEMPASERAEVAKQCTDTIQIYTDGAKERGCTI